jgi:hypothetical protein
MRELPSIIPGCRFASSGLQVTDTQFYFDQYATAWVDTMIAHLLGPFSCTR